MDDKTRTELEAAAFRRLVAHLRERTDVQNIDLMNLAGFCRNCLGNWYAEAAKERGLRSIIAAIDATNEASIRLHARFGFEHVGLFKEVGFKFDRWLDVAYMERRV